jgi:hypothetical protein
LIVESVVAAAPKMVTGVLVLCANKCIPPKAVLPLIAFVTAMSGECNECENTQDNLNTNDVGKSKGCEHGRERLDWEHKHPWLK